MNYIFCFKESDYIKPVSMELEGNYSLRIWRSSVHRIMPKGIPFRKPFFLWWVLYFPKLFIGVSFSVFLIYCRGHVVHYTLVLPKCFKFPFMGKNDLQIGPSWTHDQYRRRGIASYVLQKILESYEKKNRKLWWVVKENNKGSIQFIEKAGFVKCGIGIKRKFGIFIIENAWI